jgi:serine/threonine-protein kinase
VVAEDLPRIFGDYVLLDRLGQGASGDAHLARPLDPGRGLPAKLVIKRLHAHYAGKEEFIKRFRHEAEMAVCIDSPHVAKVYAVGASGDTLFIAMEHVAGFPLSRLLTLLTERCEKPPIPIAAALVMDGLRGLSALHRATDASGRPLQAVHRDISPKNLIAGDDGRLHLIDLGLGKSKAQDWRTEAGVIMGSPGYMAPEQISAEEVDHRSDLYAMGIVAYELLTITRYIERESIPRMLAVAITQPFVPPSTRRTDLSPEIDRVLEQAMAYDPEHRFASADDFMRSLERAVPMRTQPNETMSFMRRIFGRELDDQAERIARLIAAPIPDDAEAPAEKTEVFVERTRISVGPPSITARTMPSLEGGVEASPQPRPGRAVAKSLMITAGLLAGVGLGVGLMRERETPAPIVLHAQPAPSPPVRAPSVIARPVASPIPREDPAPPPPAPSTSKKERSRLAPRSAPKETTQEIAPQVERIEPDVATEAAAIERRVEQLRPKLARDPSKAARLERILLDVARIRRIGDTNKAMDQLKERAGELTSLEAGT